MTRSVAIEARQVGARRRGFALLIVLSALGVLAVVAAIFAQIARSHVRTAALAGEGAKAEALADAGVHMAILDLVGARGSRPTKRRVALDATPLSCSPGEGAVMTVAIRDVGGKVDLNLASPPLLRALALGLGLSGGQAAADAILDYRDRDNTPLASGAERPEYLAAGRPAGPRNAPFLAVEELTSVLGITQADADRLRPFVTIRSGLQGIDAKVASPELVDILVRGLEEGGVASLFTGEGEVTGDLSIMERHTGRLPAKLLGGSTRRAFSVRSQARTATGATFVRGAEIEFVSTRASAYRLHRWYRAASTIPGAPQTAKALPPC